MLDRVTKGEIKQAPVEVLFNSKMSGTVYVEFEFKGRMGQNIAKSLMSKINLGAAV